MKRALIDTSVFVDWFRDRRHEEVIAGRHGPPLLSAVVALELLQGTSRHQRIAHLARGFERRGRLVAPAWRVWELSAHVLRALRSRGVNVDSLVNDVLIAMTACAGGFRLFTTNGKDFERIAAIRSFDLVVLG